MPPTNQEINKSLSPFLPLVEVLKACDSPMGNIEVAEGTEEGEKTTLLRSAVTVLSENTTPHTISIVAYLIREALSKFANDNDKKAAPRVNHEQLLYDSTCFPDTELARIKKASNPQFTFIPPNKLCWLGEMSTEERDSLLDCSSHPFWRDAVFELFNKAGSTKTKKAIQEEKIRNFLEEHGTKFTLASDEILELTNRISNLFQKTNDMVHHSQKYRVVGEFIISGTNLPIDLEVELGIFQESVNEFGRLMENFKMKPIGILNQLDEIISE